MPENNPDILALTTQIVAAHVASQRVANDELPSIIESVHATLTKLSTGGAGQPEASAPEQEYTPAVSARKSLASKDHIISMIDGKPYKTMRRHLARHGLTPEQYRERYSLKADYPMVSESYSQVRRDMAKKIGLGRKAAPVPAPKPTRSRSAKPKADAAGSQGVEG